MQKKVRVEYSERGTDGKGRTVNVILFVDEKATDDDVRAEFWASPVWNTATTEKIEIKEIVAI